MKKNEVKVGAVYTAKVSDRLVQVRIDGENRHGGWDATNLATNKKVRIKSPQRLRGQVKTGGKKKSEARPEANPTVEIITGQPLTRRGPLGGTGGEATAGSEPERRVKGQPVPAKREKKARKPAADKAKRVSALDAAAHVLRAEGKPMRAKDLIEAHGRQGPVVQPRRQDARGDAVRRDDPRDPQGGRDRYRFPVSEDRSRDVRVQRASHLIACASRLHLRRLGLCRGVAPA